MSTSTIFLDSYNHYDSPQLPDKYFSTGDNGIVDNAAIARTGSRCLQIISGADGPTQNYSFVGARYPHVIMQGAWKVDNPGVGQQFNTLSFEVSGVGYNIRIRINGDSTLSIQRGNPVDAGSVSLFQTLFRPIKWNTWNWISAECVFDSVNGSVVLNVNGRQVANVTGVRTTAQVGTNFADTFQAMGTPTNGLLCYVADFAIIDPTQGTITAPIPSGKIYVTVPNADGNPVNWTPLSGANFSNVNEVPPDGDTSYNSSSTVGQVDQYQHPAIAPAGASIAAYQHCLDEKVDSGARTVASDIAGTVATGVALTTSYRINCNPQDGDPGVFPISAGPKVTA